MYSSFKVIVLIYTMMFLLTLRVMNPNCYLCKDLYTILRAFDSICLQIFMTLKG